MGQYVVYWCNKQWNQNFQYYIFLDKSFESINIIIHTLNICLIIILIVIFYMRINVNILVGCMSTTYTTIDKIN